MTPNIIVVEPPQLPARASAHIAERIRAAIRARGACHLALAGGRTPAATYGALADQDLPWDRVVIYFGDERCVPPAHADSNHRMACEALIDRLPAAPTVHRMEAERPDLEAAARDYAAALPEALDLVILGLGSDGHTASLFPRSPALSAGVLVAAAPGPGGRGRRLTLTPPALAQARELLVLVSGAGKAEALAAALRPGPAAEVPARLAAAGTWLVDAEAASRLEGAS